MVDNVGPKPFIQSDRAATQQLPQLPEPPTFSAKATAPLAKRAVGDVAGKPAPPVALGPFRYREDVVPTAIVTAGLALSLAPFVIPMSWGAIACILPVAIAARFMAPLHQHHHSHLKVFTNPILNRVYDSVLMLAGGNITAGWEMQHCRGHHRDYLDPVHDVAGTKRFGTEGRFRRLIFTLKGDALSFTDAWRIAGEEKNSGELKRRLAFQLGEQLAVNGALLALNPALAVATIIAPNALLRWAVFWHAFEQHDDAPGNDPLSGSINMSGPVSRALLNIGDHTAHHLKPTLHWSRLPAYMAKIRHKIPAECLR